jgi:circadian clock protein KaiC
MGLQFLALATPEQPGLMFGFYETADTLIAKGRSIGIDVDAMQASGALQLVWHQPFEMTLDDIGQALLSAVREQGACRVFFDGVDALRQAAGHAGRLGGFFTALIHSLRDAGATTFCTMDAKDLFAPQHVVLDELSAVPDNVVMLRFSEVEAKLVRSLGIVKTRDSEFDPSILPFVITPAGVRIGCPPDASKS